MIHFARGGCEMRAALRNLRGSRELPNCISMVGPSHPESRPKLRGRIADARGPDQRRGAWLPSRPRQAGPVFFALEWQTFADSRRRRWRGVRLARGGAELGGVRAVLRPRHRDPAHVYQRFPLWRPRQPGNDTQTLPMRERTPD